MKKLFALLAICLLVGAGCASTKQPDDQAISGNYPKYKEIEKPAGFINTDAITIGELVGKKVILLDVLTYSCINCVRTFPYVNAWYEKYKDNGLEIIGIHTPEFAFEKKYENVAEAMKKYDIKFPVVLDNEYATWNAYGNRYWPRKYLIDIHGNVVYDHIGEGSYEETEKKIQELLSERANVLGENAIVESSMAEPENVITVESRKVGSPEIYFGASRNEYLANGRPHSTGVQKLPVPNPVVKNRLYLTGEWRIDEEYSTNNKAGASIIFRYTAKQVNMVASAPDGVSARILLDGKPIGAAAGEDVTNGVVKIEEDALYELVDDPAGYGEHTLEIIIDEPGVQAFTFTFG